MSCRNRLRRHMNDIAVATKDNKAVHNTILAVKMVKLHLCRLLRKIYFVIE